MTPSTARKLLKIVYNLESMVENVTVKQKVLKSKRGKG